MEDSAGPAPANRSPEQKPALETLSVQNQLRHEIYDSLGIEQVVRDIEYAMTYLMYMRQPYRGANQLKAIMADLAEPEELNGAQDIKGNEELHAFRRHLITIDETDKYIDLPITKDVYAQDFEEAYKEARSTEQTKALEVLEKLHRLSILNASINNTPTTLIPRFIQQILDPTPPRPKLKLVQ